MEGMKLYEKGIKKIKDMTNEELKVLLKNFCPCDLGIEHRKCPDISYSCDWCWRNGEEINALYEEGVRVIRNMNDDQLKRLLYRTCPTVLDIPCNRCRNKYSCVECWSMEECKPLTTHEYLLHEIDKISFYKKGIRKIDEKLEELDYRFSIKSVDYSLLQSDNREDTSSKLNRWIENKAKFSLHRKWYVDRLNSINSLINQLYGQYKHSINRYTYKGVQDEHFKRAVKILEQLYLKYK